MTINEIKELEKSIIDEGGKFKGTNKYDQDLWISRSIDINDNAENVENSIERLEIATKVLKENKVQLLSNGVDKETFYTLLGEIVIAKNHINEKGGVYTRLDTFMVDKAYFAPNIKNNELVTSIIKEVFREEFYDGSHRLYTDISKPLVYESLYMEFGEWRDGSWYRSSFSDIENSSCVGIGLDGFCMRMEDMVNQGIIPVKVIHRGEWGRRHHDDSFYIFKR